MKHSAPPAKPEALVAVLIIVGLALFIAACAKPTQSRLQLHFAPSNPARADAMNINIASARDLETLPGIGKAIAERIIAHRERYGPFRRVEHLLMVRGISDSKFRVLLPMITVDGAGASPPS